MARIFFYKTLALQLDAHIYDYHIQVAIIIDGNLAFHEHTRNIEIDIHFIHNKVLKGGCYNNSHVVAYDPRRHQGMTLRRRRSRHPRASSPLDRQRRGMPSFTTPSEDLISPRHISQGSRARGVTFSFFFFYYELY